MRNLFSELYMLIFVPNASHCGLYYVDINVMAMLAPDLIFQDFNYL